MTEPLVFSETFVSVVGRRRRRISDLVYARSADGPLVLRGRFPRPTAPGGRTGLLRPCTIRRFAAAAVLDRQPKIILLYARTAGTGTRSAIRAIRGSEIILLYDMVSISILFCFLPPPPRFSSGPTTAVRIGAGRERERGRPMIYKSRARARERKRERASQPARQRSRRSAPNGREIINHKYIYRGNYIPDV